MAGIFSNIFGGGGPIAHNAPPTAGVPAAPQPTAPAAPTGTTPPAPPAPPQPETFSSQLDKMQALWQTPTDAAGNPIATAPNPLTQPVFNNDPAKMAEQAAKLDFTSGITPEQVSKALGGDAAALMELINTSNRNAFLAAAQYSNGVTNQGLLANNQRIIGELPRHIKEVQLGQTTADNPVLDHPAVSPIVTSLKQMLLNKNPAASPMDINKQVQDFFGVIAGAYSESSPEFKQQQTAAKAGEVNWVNWANSDSH